MADNRVYTNSEGMKMCLNPASIPKFNPIPLGGGNGGRSYNTPDTRSLIRPSMIKQAVQSARAPSAQFMPDLGGRPTSADNVQALAKAQLMKVQSRAISPAPSRWKQQRKGLQTPFSKNINFVQSGPAPPLPYYSALRDPHLYEYYARKFAAHLKPPRLRTPSRKRGTGVQETNYKVTIHVGQQLTAKSTANIFITIVGNGTSKVTKRKLTKQVGSVKTTNGKRYMFKPGSSNLFRIKGNNLANIKHVTIETDGLTKKDGIFIEEVEVQNMKNKKSWVFPCGDWLSLYESDCQISRDLFPDAKRAKAKNTTYTIQTLTGTKLGAGTDSNVFVTLYGSKGTCPRHHLHQGDHHDPFEKGQTDRFALKTKQVGDLHKLRIEHDNSGSTPGWFLEHVNVTDNGTKKSWTFECAKWLAKDEGDRRICRDLLASKGIKGKSGGKVKTYRIQVNTGNKRGAGTDANVFVTLFGTKGDSGEFQLTGSGNLFEREDQDRFTEDIPDLGTLKKIRVRHDDSGIGSGWFLDKIIVDDGNDSCEFPCNRWLAIDEDDGKISRDLLCSGSSDNLTSYQIKIKTGDKRNAGTNASVFIEMIGGKKSEDEGDSSGRIWLEGGDLERGQWDMFTVDVAGSLSPLAQVTIGHNGTGIGAGWFVDEVIVFCPSTGLEQHFLCHKWMAKDEDDGALERTLFEDKNLRKTGDKMGVWDISVHTSDRKRAGTDANVFLVIYGDKGRSEIIWLDNNSDKFERGQTDQFTVETSKIGKPYKIRIGHDNENPGAGWHLDSVDLLERSTNTKYSFKCNRWLADDEEDKQIVRELPVDAKKTLPVLKYQIDVHTGKKMGAGTDANVFCCVFGKRGDTGDRHLSHSTTHKNKFEKNNVDTFVIEAVDLNEITKLRIGHDSSGPGAGWFLDKIVVQEQGDPESVIIFPCNRWLSVDEDDGQIVRELFPSDSDHPEYNTQNLLKTCTYRLAIETGDKRGAGTDANVFVEIIGKEGSTSKITLTDSENNQDPFERGRTDLFDVESEDVGKIKRLRIGHDGKGVGAGWYLENVEIKVPSRGEVYRFAIGRWLASDEADRKLEIEVQPTEVNKLAKQVPYELTFITGDKRGAGTDANVFMQIYGLEGKTQNFNLRNKSDNFERGATDLFKVSGPDVGNVQKVRVETDEKGIASGWFLDTIRIRKPFHKHSPESSSRRSSATKDDRRSRKSKRTSIRRESTFTTLKKKAKSEKSKKRSRSNSKSRRRSNMSDENSESENEQESENEESSDSLASGTISEMDSEDSSVIRKSTKKNARSTKKSTKSSKNRSRSLKKSKHIDFDDDESSDEGSEDSDYDTYLFVCNKWFSKSEDDGQIIREFVPTEKDGKPKDNNKWGENEYEVHVFTGDISGAGTDANVFVCIYGEHGDTGERQMKRSSTHTNKFERDQEDIFLLKAADLGKLHKMKVWHDNSGIGAAWLLDRIEIVDSNTGERYIFPCEKWLSTKKDDGQICRELVAISPKLQKKLKRAGSSASLKDSMGLELSAQISTYDVYVKTGTLRGAGTDANVYLIMFGENDDTGKILLKSSKTNKNKFEAGQTDQFSVEAIGIGKLEKIIIGHDNKGGFAGWFLDSVDIDCLSEGHKWHFPCDKWLDADKDDGMLERELYPSELASKTYKACVPYEIIVHTSDIRNAGTSADVFVAVFGNKGVGSRQVSLSPNKSERKDHFNRGSVDKFIIQMEDVGEEISKLRVGHDGHGFGAGWHLDKIELKKLINDGEGHMVYEFPCNKWLAKDEGDGSIVRDLIPAAALVETFRRDGSIKSHKIKRPSSISMKRYGVKVYTGDISMAGTDANVFITIFGDKGNTGRRQLKHSETHTNKFERANVDVFSMDAGDLGKLYKVEVGHDDTLLASDWFLDRVEVTDIDKGHTVTFRAERWFGRKKEDGKLNRFIYAKGFNPDDDPENQTDSDKESHSPHSKSARSTSSHSERNGRKLSAVRRKSSGAIRKDTGVGVMLDEPHSSKTKVIPYTVHITTGDDRKAGTQAPVWIRIIGAKKDTGRLHLEIRSRDPPEFLPSTLEVFSVDAPDVGSVKQIEFAIDSKSSKDACLIDNVEVHQPTKGRSFLFDTNSWFGRGQADGKCKRSFYASSNGKSKNFQPKSEFEVMIETGDKKGCGTDCGVSLQLFGVEGSSQPITIDKDNRRFERGTTDVLLVEFEDVGEPRKLRVSLVSPGKSRSIRESWFVQNIEVTNVHKDKTYVFSAKEWLNLKEVPYIDIPALTAKGKKIIKDTEYVVNVKTGDIRGAATGAKVFVILFGEKGDSGEITLKESMSHKNKFQRNQEDQFVIKIPSLGELTKLRIWHDNKGSGASWFLDEVIVHDTATDLQYLFPCNKWLSNSEDDRQICRELECANNKARKRSTMDSSSKLQTYDIVVTTNSRRGAGTNHNAWIILYDHKNSSEKLWLENSSRKPILQKGQEDNFTFKVKPMGELKSLVLGHSPDENEKYEQDDTRENAWNCQQIIVNDHQLSYIFPCEAWIPLSTRSKDAVKLECDYVNQLHSTKEMKRGTVQYQVDVKTGDERGAGTQNAVFIAIFGEYGDTGKRELTSRSSSLFQRGHIDSFGIESTDLGRFVELIVETEGDDEWLLSRISISKGKEHRQTEFRANKWIKPKRGIAQIRLLPQ